MLNDSKPITFVAVSSAANAKNFYGGTLGLRMISEDNYAVVFDNQGIPLRASLAGSFTPARYTVLGWQVADIEQAVTTLEAGGVRFARYPFMRQDGPPIWDAPDGSGARVAWFNDLDGNVLSVSQH